MKQAKIITAVCIAFITYLAGYLTYVRNLQVNLSDKTTRIHQLHQQLAEFTQTSELSDELKASRENYSSIFKKNLINAQITPKNDRLKFTARGTLPKINAELLALSKLYHPRSVTIHVSDEDPFMELIFITDPTKQPKIPLELPEQILVVSPNYRNNVWYLDELIFEGVLTVDDGEEIGIMFTPQENVIYVKKTEQIGAEPSERITEITPDYLSTNNYICKRNQHCSR